MCRPHELVVPDSIVAGASASMKRLATISPRAHDAGEQTSSPLISIVVATYDNSATLQQCIDSVVKQTYPHKELIVIDGGSKDGTVELLEVNSQKIRYWISEPDRGIYHAWNKALVKAEGEWLCFLGADDYFWDEHVLSLMAAQLRKVSPRIGVVYGQIMLVNDKGERLYRIGKPWERLKPRFQHGMCIPHPGLMHRRSIFERHGGFNESFRIAGDYELLLRELKAADAVFVPEVVTVGMRQGKGISSHPASALLLLNETRRAQRLHGQRFPSLNWLASLTKAYFRLMLWRVFGESMARKTLDLGRRIMGQPAYWTKV